MQPSTPEGVLRARAALPGLARAGGRDGDRPGRLDVFINNAGRIVKDLGELPGRQILDGPAFHRVHLMASYSPPMSTDSSPLRVFVAGATGVVGRRLVPLLTSAGHAVTAVGRTPEKRRALERQGATAIGLSLFDVDALTHALAGHDAVVNLATHVPRSVARALLPGAWRENDRVRREGSACVAKAARAAGVRRLIQESFAPMYADGGDRWLGEDAPVRPARYNRSTLDAERSAARFSEWGGAGVVLRFGAFYGPDATHIPYMARSVRAGWAPLPGPANAYFSSVSHDDAATAVVAALGAPAGVSNVVDDEPLTRRAFADAVAAAFGCPAPRLLPSWVTPLMGSLGKLLARSQRVSNRRLRDATGWAPRVPNAREGFRALADGHTTTTS